MTSPSCLEPSKNLLFLSTFDPFDGYDGGKLRCRNLIGKYKALGYTVSVTGILSYKPQLGSKPSFLFLDDQSPVAADIDNWFLMDDARVSVTVSGNLDLYAEKIIKNVSLVPDVIHIEHPWLLSLAAAIKKKYAPSAKLIYGSANNESELKEQILSCYFSTEHVKKCRRLVEKIEQYAVQEADVCLAVTQSDADYINSIKNGVPILLVKNGATPSLPQSIYKVDKDSLNQLTASCPYALYVASAHPPNVEGFFDLLSGPAAFLSKNNRLVVVGSVASSIKNDKRFARNIYFRDKIVF
jgi:hypothetical protein